MQGLNLYSSNRLEILANDLIEVVRSPLNSPFTPEIIVVQSLGMKRWLSLQIAQALGVWTNCRFVFPNVIISEIMHSVLPEAPGGRYFDVDVMAWKIMRILPSRLDKKNFAPVKTFLEKSGGLLKRYQLSLKIADVFDQYLTYRPEMILKWDSGQDDDWQADLWRDITAQLSHKSPPFILYKFLEKIGDKNFADNIALPERISIFGISALPEFHINVLTALSGHIEVNLFLMNPSRQYWADIRSEHDIAKHLGKDNARSRRSDELHIEKGNSLLSSNGKTGRDFLWMILENYDPVDHSNFYDSLDKSILHLLQLDILDMIDRGAPGDEAPLEFGQDEIAADNSISIHSCHSPMREVEVLYDYLLDLFNNREDIEPGDIIVMTPDIETYSPYIHAVFGRQDNGLPDIPFSISDISISNESNSIETFLSVLDLTESRFEASRILGVLECKEIQLKFGLIAEDMELIRKWVIETSIRWGINASVKEELGLPGERQNTWQEGFDRLMLGYALPSENGIPFYDTLPYNNVEGNDAGIMGRFIHYFHELADCVKLLKDSYNLSGWKKVLTDLLDRLFLPDENDTTLHSARTIINDLAALQEESGFDEAVDIHVIKSCLKSALKKQQAGYGFLSGRVTFCTMLPMRSIPFKIICLVGMNSESFPRVTRSPEFNLISRNPRRGDRSQRLDDRYLFLESILSAREQLYISYIGQSIEDNSEKPPSVVVSELIDYLEQAFVISGHKIREWIITKHRLQPFSPYYFAGDKKLYSYSEENCEACRAMIGLKNSPSPYISDKLTGKDEAERIIELNDLLAFFNNPAKYLLRKKLGIYLEEHDREITDREPFETDGLNSYLIRQELIEKILSGEDPADYYKKIRLSGLIPQGKVGEVQIKSFIPAIREFCGTIRPYIEDEILPPLKIDLDLEGYRITGEIRDIKKEALVHYRHADIKAKDRLNTWIHHLLLNTADEKGYPCKSRLLCKNKFIEFPRIENSAEMLQNLIGLYREGIELPLHFFPEASYEYARLIHDKEAVDTALKKAMARFDVNPHDNRKSEIQDPYIDLCFNKINPIDKKFQNVSTSVFAPLLLHEAKI